MGNLYNHQRKRKNEVQTVNDLISKTAKEPGEEIVAINFYLPKKTRCSFKSKADLQGKAMGELLREFIASYLED